MRCELCLVPDVGDIPRANTDQTALEAAKPEPLERLERTLARNEHLPHLLASDLAKRVDVDGVTADELEHRTNVVGKRPCRTLEMGLFPCRLKPQRVDTCAPRHPLVDSERVVDIPQDERVPQVEDDGSQIGPYAQRSSTSHAIRTSSSVVRSLPTARRRT